MYEANTFMPVLRSVFSTRKKSTSIMENSTHHHDGSSSHQKKGQGKQDPCPKFPFKCPASIALEEQGKS